MATMDPTTNGHPGTPERPSEREMEAALAQAQAHGLKGSLLVAALGLGALAIGLLARARKRR